MRRPRHTTNSRRRRTDQSKLTHPGDHAFAREPLAYLITFTTYGTWLHGDARGSVDADHRLHGMALLRPDPDRAGDEIRALKHSPVFLDAPMRRIVEQTIRHVCGHRGWILHALNVRTNHVHVVIRAAEAPEHIMNALKSWFTRRMVEANLTPSHTKTWTRHGSTRYLWRQDELRLACEYVCERQGDDLPSA